MSVFCGGLLSYSLRLEEAGKCCTTGANRQIMGHAPVKDVWEVSAFQDEQEEEWRNVRMDTVRKYRDLPVALPDQSSLGNGLTG